MGKKKKQHKKPLVISLLLSGILALILCILFVAQLILVSQSNTITFTEKGFRPKSLTVDSGTTVTFINKSNTDFWPASNIHPTHDIYPEFDPKKALKPGESFSFNPKPGYWKFHDHINSSFTGTLKVRDKKGNAPLKPSCENEMDRICWEEAVIDAVKNDGIPHALSMVELFYKNEPGISGTCHSLVHIVGNEAYKKFARNEEFELTENTSICAYGFYHGFMEQLVAMTGDVTKAADFCDYVDQTLSKYASDTKLQCFHGIGHGVAVIHEDKIDGVEETILTPSLSLCEEVSRDDQELYRCASGVFNALAIYYMDGTFDISVDPDDPMKICSIQKDVFKEPCYGNMNTVLAWLANGDARKIASYIEQIEDDTLAKSTIKYGIAVVASNYLGKNIEIVSICRSLQQRLRIECIEGQVHGLIEFGKPGEEYEEALSFCAYEDLTEEEELRCHQQAMGYFYSIYPEEKAEEICQTANKPEGVQCRGEISG